MKNNLDVLQVLRAAGKAMTKEQIRKALGDETNMRTLTGILVVLRMDGKIEMSGDGHHWKAKA